jgi:hypothetical protein
MMGLKCPGCEFDHLFRLVQRLKTSGTFILRRLTEYPCHNLSLKIIQIQGHIGQSLV